MEKSPGASPETAAAAAEVAAQFRSLVSSEDVESIKQAQHLILGRLQDSNAVLTHFNEYSEQCFAEVSSDLASKARLLKSMKDDLDHIFMKLRHLLACLFFSSVSCFLISILLFSSAVLSIYGIILFSRSVIELYLCSSSPVQLTCLLRCYCRSMKSRLATTYPDAFPDGAMAKAMDQRPDLENPLE